MLIWASLIAVLTTLVCWLATAKLVEFLKRNNIVDTPNERTLHQGSVPRGGGLVIVAALVIYLTINIFTHQYNQQTIGLLLTVFAWAALGWYDDRVDAHAGIRLVCQLLLAVLAVLVFGYIDTVQWSNKIIIPLSGFGFILTILWIVWLANLYNFMDGMDGLAGSQTIVAALTLAFWFYQQGDITISISCLVLASASYAFLLWNWSPAKIFMGDVGSVAIGAFFAVLTVIGAHKYDIPIVSFMILLGVFIFDATVTLVMRLLKGEKVWQAHHQHYYQRLSHQGVAHNKIVVGLIVLMILCSLIATLTIRDHDIVWSGALGAILTLWFASRFVTRLEKKQARAR